MKRRFLIFAVVFALPIVGFAQTGGQLPASPSMSADKSSPDEQHAPGSIEEEMRAKRAIHYAENEHKENLERAHEVSQIGAQLKIAFQKKSALDRDDNKKLDRLEKLAKQLRSKAGGSDSDTPLENPPPDIKTAIARIVETSDSLSKLVEKTPRQVISATVIDEANVLVELIHLVRQYSKK